MAIWALEASAANFLKKGSSGCRILASASVFQEVLLSLGLQRPMPAARHTAQHCLWTSYACEQGSSPHAVCAVHVHLHSILQGHGSSTCMSCCMHAGRHPQLCGSASPRLGTAAWKRSSLPPMGVMTMKAACRAAPMALSTCTGASCCSCMGCIPDFRS